MHVFQDKDGVEWNVEMTIGLMEEIKGQLKVDLLEPIGEEYQAVTDLIPIDNQHIMLFCNVLYLICEDQCKEREKSSKDFGRLLGPTAIKGAYDAFFSEWQDFFHQLGRTDLVEAIGKVKSLMVKVVEDLVEKIKEIKLESQKIQETGK